MSLRMPLTMLALLIALASAHFAAAHPVHFSFAEAEWNAESQCIEVALRMEPEDLQNALRRHAGTSAARRVTLESPAAEALVRDYLLDNFVVTTSNDKSAELRWVGHEATLEAAWLYFEIALPQGPEGIQITNRLLFTESDEQVNLVAVRAGNRRGSVQLTAKAPTKPLTLTMKTGDSQP